MATGTDKPRRTSARHKARKHALDLLFEAEMRQVPPVDVLQERQADPEVTVRDFTATLVQGVWDHQTELDQSIAAALVPGWTVARMPLVDRVIARIATYELQYTETPPSIVLAEAVALAGDLSTDESPAFLNAVLKSVADASGDNPQAGVETS